MSDAAALSSGKGHRDENFPVASVLISSRHRPAILAFYRFVRTADDVADHATAGPDEKLRLLEDMRLSLMGASDASPEGVALNRLLTELKLATGDDLRIAEQAALDAKLKVANGAPKAVP